MRFDSTHILEDSLRRAAALAVRLSVSEDDADAFLRKCHQQYSTEGPSLWVHRGKVHRIV